MLLVAGSTGGGRAPEDSLKASALKQSFTVAIKRLGCHTEARCHDLLEVGC